MLLKISLLECTFANRQQGAKKIHGREAEKETCAGEKRASLGEALEKGIIMLFVCADLNSSYRAVGTSSLWSSGRLTPDGGARDGKKGNHNNFSMVSAACVNMSPNGKPKHSLKLSPASLASSFSFLICPSIHP